MLLLVNYILLLLAQVRKLRITYVDCVGLIRGRMTQKEFIKCAYCRVTRILRTYGVVNNSITLCWCKYIVVMS